MKNFNIGIMNIVKEYERISCKVKNKIGWELTEIVFLSGCIFASIMMFIRALHL